MNFMSTAHCPLSAVRIGTRKSPLALAQAHIIQSALTAAHPGLEVELIPMTTTGDRMQSGLLSEIGGKGLFTKELEEALLDGRIDLAVHSAKDMQTVLPPGLTLACVPQREDARDVLISLNNADSLAKLPPGCILGSASLRRTAQALHVRPDLRTVPLRGNVQTRLAKLQAGEAQATLLALAGLKRLGMDPPPGHVLSFDEMLPAAAQGAIGIECREADERTRALLTPLHHPASAVAVAAERALLAALDGSCRTPIAAYAELQENTLTLRAMVLSDDGATRHVTQIQAPAADALRLGEEAAKHLRSGR